ncbi:ABC transporter permease [Wukongibacter sp. M2B1]|uniref:ABC transporter permease n=1 Tax=Wukongibacter sp. M2B1 TaxID=3088895 RepID=UPI003D79645C
MNYISKDRLYTLLSILVLIIIWKVSSYFIGYELILPTPEETTNSLITIIKGEAFWQIVFNTVRRCLLSFSISFLLGTTMGIMAGMFRPVYYLLKPLVIIKKATPTTAIVLLVLLWLGSEAPILISFLVTFPIIYSNVVEGVRNVDIRIIEMARAYKVNKARILYELYLPSILPYIMAGASSALGLNLKVIIAAEAWSQAPKSIGDSFLIEKISLNTSGIFAWTIVVILISAAFDYLLRYIEKRTVKWK